MNPMLIEHQHPDNKSIIVAVLGSPNVGKSTLINHFLGTDLSVVTPKPQTTRNQFHCIFTVDRTEIILVDTPGLHRSNQEINKRMNEEARLGASEKDLSLLLIDPHHEVFKQFSEFKYNIRQDLENLWVVFTKSDRLKNPADVPWDDIVKEAQKILPIQRYFVVSAKTGDNIHLLLGALCDAAKPAPHRYPDGDISNKNERFFVTEYIRQQAFELLQEELPYEIAVVIDEYRDFRDRGEENKKIVAHISASIVVNRPSQRAIVIGSGGEMIKKIGTLARERIENMIGGQVHLNLHVKVIPRWFKNNFVLEDIGLYRAPDSNRVWRKET
jgi:GTPase